MGLPGTINKDTNSNNNVHQRRLLRIRIAITMPVGFRRGSGKGPKILCFYTFKSRIFFCWFCWGKSKFLPPPPPAEYFCPPLEKNLWTLMRLPVLKFLYTNSFLNNINNYMFFEENGSTNCLRTCSTLTTASSSTRRWTSTPYRSTQIRVSKNLFISKCNELGSGIRSSLCQRQVT